MSKWTEEEIEYLKENYENESWDELLKNINHNKGSIISKASHLKIKRHKDFWDQKDEKILFECYKDKILVEQISKLLNNKYSINSIYQKALCIGITQKPKWTDEEINILYRYYKNEEISHIEKLFPNRKKDDIVAKARKLGLVSPCIWTKDEDKYIIENWELTPDIIMAQNLKRSFRSVKWRREYLGIYRRDLYSKNYESISKYLRANISNWKNESMKTCNYQCVLTGSKDYHIHHLYSVSNMVKETFNILNFAPKNNFEEYSEDELKIILTEFIEIQNLYPLGECVRKDIHTLFHKMYGKHSTTPSQWYEFKRNYKNGIYNNLKIA